MARRHFVRDLIFGSSRAVEVAYTATIAAMQEEEERSRSTRRGGSVPRRRFIERNRLEGHERLYNDYFAENPVYPEAIFRRRFRMRRALFLRIVNAVEANEDYFKQKGNNAGTLGASALQKVTAAIRMIAYGVSADSLDEYVPIAGSTILESTKVFAKTVVTVFGDQYLREPNEEDTRRLLAMGEQRGFPGKLGSIDCMHWEWKNCPTAWHGSHTGHANAPTLILEAVASHDLWIWHSFFGMAGSNNDINVLQRSPLFSRFADGRAPKVMYVVNGNTYNMGCYLADGIYLEWASFVKAISAPQGNKRKLFSIAQIAERKEVERAFGVLQARFHIVKGPTRFWDPETLHDIMTACIIMHNMIVEDERDITSPDWSYEGFEGLVSHSRESNPTVEKYIARYQGITDPQKHHQHREDLVEHMWRYHGSK